MQDTIARPSPAEAGAPPPRRSGAAVFNLVAGWVLLIVFIVTFAACLAQGSGAASQYDLMKKLESDAREGVVTTVEVESLSGGRLDSVTMPPTNGYRFVTVSWREGLLRRHTQYVVASSEAQARKARSDDRRATPVVVAPDSLQGHWEDVQPDVSVVAGEGRHSAGGSTEVFGIEWSVPSWAVLLGGLVAGLGTLTRLVVGPQPWRLTRWAWAWPILLAWPIGVPAFLLFSGATGLLPPSDPQRRVGGLVSLLLTAALTWLISSAL